MNCQVIMEPDIIQSLVSDELWEKYQKFKLRAQLIQDPSVCFCIALNCEGFVRGSNLNPRCTCPTCG